MNSENIIKEASKILKKNHICSYSLDAELILADIIGVKRENLITNFNFNISDKNKKKYNFAIRRRANGEPLAYIIGKKEFWSEDFFVNCSTLVPRPETELLIYKTKNYFNNKSINILDVGTGSGCILLSILKELPLSRGTGIDISPKAIQTAKNNSKKLKLYHRSKFKLIDIDKYNLGKFDLIVSNPPYVPSGEIKNLSREIVEYEPRKAIDGGPDGLDLIKKVIYKSTKLLKRNGLLFIEIGYKQYKKVSDILRFQGYREVDKEIDYNQNVRCIISTKARF